MIRGSTPDLLLVELRLPPGFIALDPLDLPEFDGEVLRIELLGENGRIAAWAWSDSGLPWHEAIAWRVAEDGIAEPCSSCGRLTRLVVGKGKDQEALCEGCGSGDWGDY